MTDASGHFSLGNVPNYSILVFSYSGKIIELKPEFNSTMSVRMTIDKENTRPFQIRGSDQKAQPLVVIDGVESVNGFNGINPNDIRSVSVLKDKSATDKYGEKGRDGVIEIAMKKKTP